MNKGEVWFVEFPLEEDESKFMMKGDNTRHFSGEMNRRKRENIHMR